jgi:hypothetical protein
MKTRTETVRVGEMLGPVNWQYNFRPHFDCYCADDATQQKFCDAKVEQLRQLADGTEWEATTDGGWPRCGWGKVLYVGMYDGWPYWRPVPSVCIASKCGASWHSFDSVTSIRKPNVKNEAEAERR